MRGKQEVVRGKSMFVRGKPGFMRGKKRFMLNLIISCQKRCFYALSNKLPPHFVNNQHLQKIKKPISPGFRQAKTEKPPKNRTNHFLRFVLLSFVFLLNIFKPAQDQSIRRWFRQRFLPECLPWSLTRQLFCRPGRWQSPYGYGFAAFSSALFG